MLPIFFHIYKVQFYNYFYFPSVYRGYVIVVMKPLLCDIIQSPG